MDRSLETVPEAGVAPPVAPASAVCPLADLPASIHDYIHTLEKRVTDLETFLQNLSAELQKNREAMKGLGGIIFRGPAKAFVAVLPKEAQKKLQEFFGDGA